MSENLQNLNLTYPAGVGPDSGYAYTRARTHTGARAHTGTHKHRRRHTQAHLGAHTGTLRHTERLDRLCGHVH